MKSCDLCGEDIPEGQEYRATVKVDMPGTHCTYGRDTTATMPATACEECSSKSCAGKEGKHGD